ncbi:Protein HEADING DATE 3B [Glycine soja]|nr:Protein HEADING DATE 3B [Glycine soja]
MVMVDPDAPSPSNPNFRDTYIVCMICTYVGNEAVSYESPRPRTLIVLFHQQFRQRVYAPG